MIDFADLSPISLFLTFGFFFSDGSNREFFFKSWSVSVFPLPSSIKQSMLVFKRQRKLPMQVILAFEFIFGNVYACHNLWTPDWSSVSKSRVRSCKLIIFKGGVLRLFKAPGVHYVFPISRLGYAQQRKHNQFHLAKTIYTQWRPSKGRKK